MNDKLETIFPNSKINFLKYENLRNDKKTFFKLSKILKVDHHETLNISKKG